MKTHLGWAHKLAAVGFTGMTAALFLGGCNNNADTQNAQSAAPTALENDAPTNSAAPGDESQPHSHNKADDAELGVHARNTKIEVSMQPATLVPNKMATWTIRVLDKKSGKPVKDFEVEMTKLMHLIVVKSDLSWFNHIHPTYKGNGVFTVSAMVPRDGSYKMYADYTPSGKSQEVPQYAFNVGASKTETPLLIADKPDAKGWMIQTVVSHPEGQPDGANGATYQVALMTMPTRLVSGQNVMLHFQVRDANGRPVKDLQPYLGTMGHLVVLSSDTNIYLHSHPMGSAMKMGDMDMKDMDMKGMKMSFGGAQPALQFTLVSSATAAKQPFRLVHEESAPVTNSSEVVFHTNFPRAGIYKAWGQFRHQDKIITAPFVLNVGQGATKMAQSSTRSGAKNVIYTCPMHPEVQSEKPDNCPKCGMTLVPGA